MIGPNEEIIYPNKVEKLFFEGELAVILKDKVKNIEPNEVDNHILGYTCFNDITAVDLIEKDKGQLTRGKYFDTFSAIGPAIVTDLPVENLQIISKRNGEIKQNSNTNQMIFSVRQIVSFISKIMTLTPFDVIATGTPAGACEIKKGDDLEIIIEKIGVLNNKVR
ncbi:Fumarylacetoacetate (FAA) hydrolase family protein [Anaerobranca californiensis DSM 14826]|uniref:Fumarylacetoacetate (FAA) hydrolase family protein n=1 Tax=Anaerobranca californiensis DSM 14826 TaxID=1120989 RepID=A0A1M6K822_9FIRM|nr:Fumarylacetoacetate (FAA) hydrolase family protein [Anaerobranca californiensis DSM 14826]